MRFRILEVLDQRDPFRIIRFVFLIAIVAIGTSVNAADDVQQSDEDSRFLVKQSGKLVRKGRLDEAEKILRALLGREPGHSAAKVQLAYVSLKKRKLIEAYELSFEVARAEPKNSRAFAVLGMTLLTAGNFKDAEQILVSSLRINKKEALAWAGLGMLDFYENRIDKAIENLREAAFYDDKDPDFVFSLAQVSARAERYKESALAYQRFLDVSSDTDSERRERIKGLINFLTYLGRKPSMYDIAGADRVSVRIELLRDRPVLEVRINKSDEPLRFVLDTGSGISVISRETAERLKIKSITRGGLARAIGGDGKFEIVYGFLKTVNIGDVQIRNVPVYIRKFHQTDERIDGYIGLSLISKFLTTLDYGKQKFSLIRKDVADELKVVENSDLFLPLRLTPSGFLSGEVQLEGIENRLNFIVDTGASVSVISDDLAGTEEIGRFLREEKLRVIGAAGITDNVRSFMLPRVTFGNHSRESIMAVALDLDIINEASGFTQSGILGGNFLKNYKLTFDFKNSKVIFSPLNK
ncbi:MAG TPA: aspartyl protease family protein [Pyrinomonadaceae bacterium]|nr:aspartyl protease family protein [Pyrinomonadaceae bacterium]